MSIWPVDGVADAVEVEILKLLQAVEALANPGCCRGQGVTRFQILGRDGRPTGGEVVSCNGCGREINETT